MRKLFLSILGIVVTKMVVATMKKPSKPRLIERKVFELQDKFRGLDTV